MNLVLHCPHHGDRYATLLCQHLPNGIHLGFFAADAPGDPHPDAWCGACDEVLRIEQGVLPLDMVDNSAGLLERAPGRAGPAPARVSGTPIRRGHAVILVATPLLVDRCASFVLAYPVGVP